MAKLIVMLCLFAANVVAAEFGGADVAARLEHRQSFWANGRLRQDATFLDGALTGEYRTYYQSGAPYEVRHYVNGHEAGRQQSWSEDGELFLNYDVRHGRRYGLVNSKPCIEVSTPEDRP